MSAVTEDKLILNYKQTFLFLLLFEKFESMVTLQIYNAGAGDVAVSAGLIVAKVISREYLKLKWKVLKTFVVCGDVAESVIV